MNLNRDLQRKQVERCSRMYKTNKFAADAMGVSTGSFSRMCLRFNVESPNQKRDRIATERVVGFGKPGSGDPGRDPRLDTPPDIEKSCGQTPAPDLQEGG